MSMNVPVIRIDVARTFGVSKIYQIKHDGDIIWPNIASNGKHRK
jgi:hypothetical protein